MQPVDETLRADVVNAIRHVFNTGKRDIVPATKLLSDLGAESIDLLDLELELEKRLKLATQLKLRNVFEARRKATGQSNIDVTVQDIVEYLRNESNERVSELSDGRSE